MSARHRAGSARSSAQLPNSIDSIVARTSARIVVTVRFLSPASGGWGGEQLRERGLGAVPLSRGIVASWRRRAGRRRSCFADGAHGGRPPPPGGRLDRRRPRANSAARELVRGGSSAKPPAATAWSEALGRWSAHLAAIVHGRRHRARQAGRLLVGDGTLILAEILSLPLRRRRLAHWALPPSTTVSRWSDELALANASTSSTSDHRDDATRLGRRARCRAAQCGRENRRSQDWSPSSQELRGRCWTASPRGRAAPVDDKVWGLPAHRSPAPPGFEPPAETATRQRLVAAVAADGPVTPPARSARGPRRKAENSSRTCPATGSRPLRRSPGLLGGDAVKKAVEEMEARSGGRHDPGDHGHNN